jgi:hypothetical protein
MDKVGLIFRNPDGSFRVGPIPLLGGPFESASDYFKSWARVNSLPSSKITADYNRDFPDRISRLAAHLSSYDRGPFPIFHPDFANHNLLVNDQYDLIGVIDWGGSLTLPREFIQLFPMDLQSLHEIFWKNGPFDGPRARERQANVEAWQMQYISCIKEEETRLGRSDDLSGKIGGIGSQLMETLLMFERRNQNPLGRLLDVFEETLVEV